MGVRVKWRVRIERTLSVISLREEGVNRGGLVFLLQADDQGRLSDEPGGLSHGHAALSPQVWQLSVIGELVFHYIITFFVLFFETWCDIFDRILELKVRAVIISLKKV